MSFDPTAFDDPSEDPDEFAQVRDDDSEDRKRKEREDDADPPFDPRTGSRSGGSDDSGSGGGSRTPPPDKRGDVISGGSSSSESTGSQQGSGSGSSASSSSGDDEFDPESFEDRSQDADEFAQVDASPAPADPDPDMVEVEDRREDDFAGPTPGQVPAGTTGNTGDQPSEEIVVEEGESVEEAAADRFDEETPIDVTEDDIVRTDDGVKLSDAALNRISDTREDQLRTLLRDPDEFAQPDAADADPTQLFDERDFIAPTASDRDLVFDRRVIDNGPTATQEVLAKQDLEQRLEEETGADDLERGSDFTIVEDEDALVANLTEEGLDSVHDQQDLTDVTPAFVPQGPVFDDVTENAQVGETLPILSALTIGANAVDDLQDFDERSRSRGRQNVNIIEDETRETFAQTQLVGSATEPSPLQGSGATVGETVIPVGTFARDTTLDVVSDTPNLQLRGRATEPSPTEGSGPTVGDVAGTTTDTVSPVADASQNIVVKGSATNPYPLDDPDGDTLTTGEVADTAREGDVPSAAAAPVAVTGVNPVVAGGVLAGLAIATYQPGELETPEQPPEASAELEIPERGGQQASEIAVPLEPGQSVSAGELGLPEEAFQQTSNGEIPVTIQEGDAVIQDGEIELPADTTAVAAQERYEEEEEEEEEEEGEEEEEQMVVVEVPEELIPDEEVVIGGEAGEVSEDVEEPEIDQEAVEDATEFIQPGSQVGAGSFEIGEEFGDESFGELPFEETGTVDVSESFQDPDFGQEFSTGSQSGGQTPFAGGGAESRDRVDSVPDFGFDVDVGVDAAQTPATDQFSALDQVLIDEPVFDNPSVPSDPGIDNPTTPEPGFPDTPFTTEMGPPDSPPQRPPRPPTFPGFGGGEFEEDDTGGGFGEFQFEFEGPSPDDVVFGGLEEFGFEDEDPQFAPEDGEAFGVGGDDRGGDPFDDFLL